MANLAAGGGVEAQSRFQQYNYAATSSLVLSVDSRDLDIHEPTTEPESLSRRIDPRTCGERVYRGKPPNLGKKRGLLPVVCEPVERKRPCVREESVLTLLDEGVYKPKSGATRAAYEGMLSLIQAQLGGQPLDVVCGAADEVLAVLKNVKVRDLDKREAIEQLLGPMAVISFDQLVSVGRLITDYQNGSDDDASESDVAGCGDYAFDDGVGVAVEFEDSEEEELESDHDIVCEDDMLDGDDTVTLKLDGGIGDEDLQEAKVGMPLDVRDIDAHWLQRKISEAYERHIVPEQSQKLAEEVLRLLAEGDDSEVETKLLMHLKRDKFSLIKYLLQNWLKIVWCTRLQRAEDQVTRKKIEDQMVGLGPDLVAVLEQLHASRATVKERQKNLEKCIRKRHVS